MISAINVTKTYGEGEAQFQVLKGVNLQIESGEFAVILGASGSGKSTLLNVISGVERADGGKIICNNIDISGLSDKELTAFRKNNVGFIFQQYYLLPNLTVDKNVKMGAALAGNKEYRQIIEALGLGDKLHKMPHELSGGEQQRVSIARALSKKPSVLFLDEPTGALDESTGRQVLNFVAELHANLHFTMVMVTHNQNIAEMANTVFVMNSGNIIKTYKNKTPKTASEIGW